MRQPHRAHRWRLASQSDDGRRLLACRYRLCAETTVVDPARRTEKADRIERMARRVFAEELADVRQLTIWP